MKNADAFYPPLSSSLSKDNREGTMGLDLTELQTKGWAIVDGISSGEDLLALGKTLGVPAQTPNGELVKEIRRLPKDTAPPGSQSALYGAGPFPLHTDTVFWPLPVRYVLLRGYGDTRRPTTIRSFAELVADCGEEFHARSRDSVWLVAAGPKPFYCSLQFQHGSTSGWRYDFDLMTPANADAEHVNDILQPLAAADGVPGITWSGNQAVVISNWHVLHGRGPQPPDEGIRVIERLYVR